VRRPRPPRAPRDGEPRGGGEEQPEGALPSPGGAPLVAALLGLGAALLWIGLGAFGSPEAREISYSAFKAHRAAGEVGPEEIRGTLRVRPDGSSSPQPGGPEGAPAVTERTFRTVRVDDPELVPQLEAAGVDDRGGRASELPQLLLLALLPVGVLVLLWVWVLRRMGGMGAGGGAGTGR